MKPISFLAKIQSTWCVKKLQAIKKTEKLELQNSAFKNVRTHSAPSVNILAKSNHPGWGEGWGEGKEINSFPVFEKTGKE